MEFQQQICQIFFIRIFIFVQINILQGPKILIESAQKQMRPYLRQPKTWQKRDYAAAEAQ